MRLALTDRFVSTCKAITSPQTDYFDQRTPGLSLRVTVGGHTTWCLLFTPPHAQKRARLSIGTYPATSLAAARVRALEARGMVEAGEDPRTAFGAQANGAMTVAALLENWLAKRVRPNLRSAPQIERRVRKSILPVIGTVRLADLHRRDINRVLDVIIERGARYEATRTFADLHAALRWAVGRGDLDRNPAEGMTAPAAARLRDRVLSDEEVRQIWNALPQALSSKSVQRIIKLCLITGQRVGEVAGMQRAELDLAAREWKLPGARTKNGHPHIVPLSDLAVIII